MKKISIEILGMQSKSCSTIINTALIKTAGVVDVNINFCTKQAKVEYDDKIIREIDLLEIVSKKGYTAKLPSLNFIYDGNEKELEKLIKLRELKLRLYLSILFTMPVLVTYFIQFKYQYLIVFILSTLVQFYIAYPIYKNTIESLRDKIFNKDLLIITATTLIYLYSVYLLIAGSANSYFETNTLIITLVIFGKYIEATVRRKTTDAIKKLMNLSPQKATVIRNQKELIIAINEVRVGDIILVKPGERIPVDGIITQGNSDIDEFAITGENATVEKREGERVIGSTINGHGSFKFMASKVGKNTMLSQIIKIMEGAQQKKAPIQLFSENITSYFIPSVITIAILTFLTWYFVFGQQFSYAFLSTMSVLVIACPFALALSTSSALMTSTGKGAKNGILFKQNDVLEITNNVNTIILDKTGTITKGNFDVNDIIEFGKMPQKRILQIVASMEKNSEHPVAHAIIKKAKDLEIKLKEIKNFKAIMGLGIEAVFEGKKYYLGNSMLMQELNLKSQVFKEQVLPLEESGLSVMYFADEKEIIGIISVRDQIRETSAYAIKKLKEKGFDIIMLTGDNITTANTIAKIVGIENVHAQILPNEKVIYIKKLQEMGKTVAMVGDGINDYPALAQADIGFAMSSGADITIENASIILMKNDLIDVEKAIRLSKITMQKIKQNLVWTLIYNVFAISIAAGLLYILTGWFLSPIIAGTVMTMNLFIVVLNSFLLKLNQL